MTQVRRQLSEGHSLVRETWDRLRQSQEENEMITRRRDELEGRLTALEAEYEDLLGERHLSISPVHPCDSKNLLSREDPPR